MTAAALEQTLAQLAAVREENAKLQARVADLEQVVADGA
jgi:cell division protein FtsB